jgi:hypothetical protein
MVVRSCKHRAAAFRAANKFYILLPARRKRLAHRLAQRREVRRIELLVNVVSIRRTAVSS